MIATILGIIDIFIGYSLMSNSFQNLFGYFAYILLAKGILSVLGSLGSGYLFDWMGYLDIIVGTVFFLTTLKIYFTFFTAIGLLMMLKGIYSLVRSLFKI